MRQLYRVEPERDGVHVIGLSDEAATFKSNKIGIEVFVGRQFFTFTARALAMRRGCRADIAGRDQAAACDGKG